MSRRARALVIEQWTHEPGWTFTADGIWRATRDDDETADDRRAKAIEGRDAICAAFAEARDLGYFVPVPYMTPEGLVILFTLDRDVAPDDGRGFVYIPWELLRSPALSYRARGLLAERLADGDTAAGRTVATFRGGIADLALARPDGRDATRTALAELELLGYCLRSQTRKAFGMRATMTFRSWGSDDADTPVDNAPADQPVDGFPVADYQGHRVSWDDDVFLLVRTGDGFPDLMKDSRDSFEENNLPGARSVRSVHLGDAREGETPPASEQDHDSREMPEGSAAETSADSPEINDKAGERTGPSRKAWALLASLPRVFRDGAPGWVRGRAAELLDRMLTEGLPAAAIVAAGHDHTRDLSAPVERHHLAALRQVRRMVIRDLMAGDLCRGCGARRDGHPCLHCTQPEPPADQHGPCCDPADGGEACPGCTVLDPTPEQLARIAAFLDSGPADSPTLWDVLDGVDSRTPAQARGSRAARMNDERNRQSLALAGQLPG
ncbi:hypothetical protein GCM10022221_67140 [Actinocorallia aurea]